MLYSATEPELYCLIEQNRTELVLPASTEENKLTLLAQTDFFLTQPNSDNSDRHSGRFLSE